MKASRLSFFAEGLPKGQPRPRQGKFGFYNPSVVNAWKKQIAGAAMEAVIHSGGWTHEEEAVFVSCDFLFERPKSHLRADGALRKGYSEEMVKKPDLDNLVKAVWDTLSKSGIIKDDRFIVSSSETKRYLAEGEGKTGVMVRVELIDLIVWDGTKTETGGTCDGCGNEAKLYNVKGFAEFGYKDGDYCFDCAEDARGGRE